jgi:uncharacterized OB-fold protein
MDETALKAVLPRPTSASAPFWEACNREELLLPRCEDCGTIFYYPRIACPHCASLRLGWVRSLGRGRIFSLTRVHVSFQGDAWRSQLPYIVILVDLDEGPRMISRLIGADREEAVSGDGVEVVFPQVDGQRLPFFRRVAAD